MPTGQRKAGGFTLLELLIAMTLLGFILALLFGGMRLASRSWDAGELRSGYSMHLSLLQGFLRRELSQISPYRWKKKTDTEMAFTGESGRLRFVAPIAARLEPGGLYMVSLELVKDGENSQLVMRRAIPYSDSGDFTALDNAEKVVLAEQVEALAFSYYGPESKDAEARWSDKWANPTLLPGLIRIRIKFSNARSWPDLVVVPQTGGDAGEDPGCKWVPGCVNGRRPR